MVGLMGERMGERRRSSCVGRCLIGVLTLWVLGCGDGSESVYDVGGADDVRRGGACDIRTTSCQQAVLEATLEARGGELRLPEVYVITPEQFIDRIIEASAPEDLAPPDPDWVRALSYFDLMPSVWSSDDDLGQLADDVAAAYFHEGDYIVVLDHGDTTASAEAVFTLSHELVHAMQDAEHDLGRINDDFADASTDEYLGMLGLVEGEAVLYSMQATFESPPETADEWDSFFDIYLGVLQDDALMDPAPYASAALNFPYGQGARFVVDAYLAGGSDAVDALYDDIPDSTLRVLAGPATPEPAGGWPANLPELSDSQLPEGFSVVAQDELGAWLFELFASRMELPVTAGRLPFAYRSDAFAALSNGSEVVGVWALRFAPRELSAALDGLGSLGSGFHVEPRGEDQLLLLAGPTGLDLAAFASALDWPAGSAGVAVNASRLPSRLRALRSQSWRSEKNRALVHHEH